METLYDVQQLLKQFNIYVYVGKRLYDIELMQIELKNLYNSRLVDEASYKRAWLILKREHRLELSRNERQ